MVRTIGAHAAIAADETGVAEIDPGILEVMGVVPRHRFVPDALVDFAYADMPLPVSQEQSIAQPYLVALMTHLARITPDDIVFETGTGAGYHAAVLSKLARRVVSVEVVAPLALEASAARPDLKVLFVSGHSDDVLTHHGELDPDTNFLEKPFTSTHW